MTTVNYSASRSYSGNRPYADVVLLGTSGARHTYKALVDTGADYLQLPILAAGRAGYSFSGSVNKQVKTAGGSVTMTLLKGVTVEIEGIKVTVDLLLDPNPKSRPLLGRQALLAAVESGFNTKEWLWV